MKNKFLSIFLGSFAKRSEKILGVFSKTLAKLQKLNDQIERQLADHYDTLIKTEAKIEDHKAVIDQNKKVIGNIQNLIK